MKTTCVALLLLLIFSTVEANTTNPEGLEAQDPARIELGELINDIFEDKTGLVKKENPELKIIILNNDFRKVREDNISSMDEINAQSTLVPVIYRSEFVAEIYNVSYYILKD